LYLFFDTETTGLARNWKAPVTDVANWPRIVQLAWVECDDAGAVIGQAEWIIRPDGYTIPLEASRIHGITMEIAFGTGVPIGQALAEFASAAAVHTIGVAHNLKFDESVLGAEFIRAGLNNPLAKLKRICTMQVSTSYCRIEGRYGFKWPTLEELHRHLFDEAPSAAHSASGDARACARCFFELRLRKVIP
jgi:DNA polymerase III epsilon subunit-like protein